MLPGSPSGTAGGQWGAGFGEVPIARGWGSPGAESEHERASHREQLFPIAAPQQWWAGTGRVGRGLLKGPLPRALPRELSKGPGFALSGQSSRPGQNHSSPPPSRPTGAWVAPALGQVSHRSPAWLHPPASRRVREGKSPPPAPAESGWPGTDPGGLAPGGKF